MDFEINDDDELNHDGIYKIVDPELRNLVIESIRIDRRMAVLKSKADYYQNLCCYEAAFGREDGRPSVELGFTGVNARDLCYTTMDTHDGPKLEGKAREYGVKSLHALDQKERLREDDRLVNKDLWDEIYDSFKLDTEINWALDSFNMVVTRKTSGSSDLGNFFNGLFGKS